MVTQDVRRFEDRLERRRRQGEAWSNLIADILPASAASSFSFHSVGSICAVLQPFFGQPNIAFRSPDGYSNLTAAIPAAEKGCIELRATSEVSAIVRPRRCTVERIDQDLSHSFLLLELDELTPLQSPANWADNCERVWEIAPGDYVPYDEIDEEDAEFHDDHPSPRIVTRWFGGHILIVSPCSMLNSVRRGTDGCYTRLSAAQIREIIETVLQNIGD